MTLWAYTLLRRLCSVKTEDKEFLEGEWIWDQSRIVILLMSANGRSNFFPINFWN